MIAVDGQQEKAKEPRPKLSSGHQQIDSESRGRFLGRLGSILLRLSFGKVRFSRRNIYDEKQGHFD
jgi:hypothetical protein